MEHRNRIYHIMYGVMLAGFVFMVIWLSFHNHASSLVDELSNNHLSLETGWYLADGSGVDVSHLDELSDAEPYQEVSIYHTLPSDLEEGLSLCFRSKNIFYQVYIDGVQRYAPEVSESYLYNDSLGTRWNYVPLRLDDAGGVVELRFYTVYDSSTACIDHLYLGNAAGEILSTFSDKTVAFITSLLLLFIGVILIVADIPINMQLQKNHELLYLGFFAVSIAIWCAVETNLFQFFTNDSRLLQLVSCTSLMLIPIPMLLYLDAAFGFRSHFVVPLFCSMSVAETAICTLLHFTKILDYHDTLTLSHVMLAISAVILLITIIRNSFLMGQSQVKNVYKVLRAGGLMVIGFATGIDIIRFYRGNGGDSAMFVRIGLLIFILCYGSSSLEKTINAVKLGVQSEFVSQLAYRDGLTGIGNRTAFQERLVELEAIKTSMDGVGIVMFDVNDLKYVNDNMGHQKGDDLLVNSANLIKNALKTVGGTCYRIGGDEFVAVLSGEDVRTRIAEGLAHFAQDVKAYNEASSQPFQISVASGYAIYDGQQEDMKLMDIYQQADESMYANKKKMKGQK